jgi:hypothetical protein
MGFNSGLKGLSNIKAPLANSPVWRQVRWHHSQGGPIRGTNLPYKDVLQDTFRQWQRKDNCVACDSWGKMATGGSDHSRPGLPVAVPIVCVFKCSVPMIRRIRLGTPLIFTIIILYFHIIFVPAYQFFISIISQYHHQIFLRCGTPPPPPPLKY